jgi:hypothetical protein
MTAAKVWADYDQLKQIAFTFQHNVEASRRTLETIRRDKETLQGGDWGGQKDEYLKKWDAAHAPGP